MNPISRMVEKSQRVGQETEEKEDDAREEEALAFYKLLRYADAIDWGLMALGTLGAVIHGMAQPIGYLLLGQALNAFGNNIDDNDAMVKAILEVVPYVWYMAIATLPAGILETGCWMYTSERQLVRMRLAFLRAVLTQEIGAFEKDLTSGKIISGISSHMSVIQDAIGEKLAHFLSNLATFLSGIVIAAICSWELALLTLVVVPLILVIGATYTMKMNSISAAKMLYLSQATSMVQETISQIKTIFAFVGENRAIKGFSECMAKQLVLSKGEALMKGVGTGILQTVTFCSWALIIWVGAIVVTEKRSTGGDVIAAVMCILFGALSLTHAAPDMQIFNQAKTAGTEVFKVIHREPAISYNPTAKTLEKIDGNIFVHDVYFSYPSRKDKLVLQGFSLSIPAGKMLGLVGHSGCGKSTLISLLTRFYDPSKGDILIDNHNIKDLDLKFLRKNIGVVSQEPSLFAGSIKDNIKVGNMNADDQQIQNAALLANAHTFISKLPNQYATEVGQSGAQLSGGQKQRIAIARAILKNPPILLLDEATSALDSESEKLVQDALEKAMKERTVITIAHRLSTIKNADIVAIVDEGQVTETGTHLSLLDTSKFYSNLFSMQKLSPINNSSFEETEEPASNNQKFSSPDIDQNEQFSYLDMDQHAEPKKPSKLEEPIKQVEHEGERKMDIFFRIWFDLKRKELVQTAIGTFAAAFSGLSKPVFGYLIITIGVAYYHPDARKKVGRYSIVFSLIGAISLFSHTLQHYFFGMVGEKAMTNLRKSLYAAILRNEVGWFEKPESNVGSLTSRVVGDTSMVKIVISDRMSIIVQCISSILIATIVSMVVNWRMGLVAWAVMPCHFIGGLIQAKSAQGFSGDSAAPHGEVVSLASESAANIRTIVSFCYEEQVFSKAKTSLEVPMRKCRRESIKYGMIQGVSLCLWNMAHAVALWYTAILIKRNQATFKDGIRAYQIFSLTVPSITELWMLIPTILSAVGILTPAFETLDRKTEIEPDMTEDPPVDQITGRIDFKNVKFSYPSRPTVPALNDFSLQIDHGLRVALVGPSGAGKSSVLALLLRFYNPREGMILIDGKDIKGYNLQKLRKHMGFVQQEPLLFSSSIRENISYGTDGASEAEIMEVSIKASIHEFISSLPDGYDTIIGEKGCQLSGGQKQRIAIARALIKKPVILLLDEATSALDAESEKSVVSALESVNKIRHGDSRFTQITVAHRLSTVINSDQIVVMDKGQIVETGSHLTLSSNFGGLYSRLFKHQKLSRE